MGSAPCWAKNNENLWQPILTCVIEFENNAIKMYIQTHVLKYQRRHASTAVNGDIVMKFLPFLWSLSLQALSTFQFILRTIVIILFVFVDYRQQIKADPCYELARRSLQTNTRGCRNSLVITNQPTGATLWSIYNMQLLVKGSIQNNIQYVTVNNVGGKITISYNLCKIPNHSVYFPSCLHSTMRKSCTNMNLIYF